jgi:uncharacterized membrane protein
MRIRILASLGVMALGLLLATSGCGGGVRYVDTGATLEGSVAYGKEKITIAMVVAQNSNGSSTAFVDESGHYKLENVPLGEVSIALNIQAGKGQAIGKLMAATKGKATSGPKVIDVPEQYTDPAKSPIKTTIVKGANQFDIVVPR